MKILFRYDIPSDSAARGDLSFLEQTRRQLEKLGLKAEVKGRETINIKEYDVVHVFNLTSETYFYCKEAKAHGIPIALTPLYWNEDFPLFDHGLIHAVPGLLSRSNNENLPLSFRLKKKFSKKWTRQKYCLDAAAAVLPTGNPEKGIIIRDFRTNPDKIKLVPVGVNSDCLNGNEEMFVKKYGLKDFILCVGRIDPRKNQSTLITATRGMEIPVVFVGYEDHNQFGEYIKKCKNEAHEKVLFLGEIDRELLISAYYAASVFALPSFFELPGLVYLEAIICGCPVVCTAAGNTYDYFGDMAFYCDPWDVNSLKTAITSAMKQGKNNNLKDYVLRNFLWEKSAQILLQVYDELLSVGKER